MYYLGDFIVFYGSFPSHEELMNKSILYDELSTICMLFSILYRFYVLFTSSVYMILFHLFSIVFG